MKPKATETQYKKLTKIIHKKKYTFLSNDNGRLIKKLVSKPVFKSSCAQREKEQREDVTIDTPCSQKVSRAVQSVE